MAKKETISTPAETAIDLAGIEDSDVDFSSPVVTPTPTEAAAMEVDRIDHETTRYDYSVILALLAKRTSELSGEIEEQTGLLEDLEFDTLALRADRDVILAILAKLEYAVMDAELKIKKAWLKIRKAMR